MILRTCASRSHETAPERAARFRCPVLLSTEQSVDQIGLALRFRRDFRLSDLGRQIDDFHRFEDVPRPGVAVGGRGFGSFFPGGGEIVFELLYPFWRRSAGP